MRRISTGSVRSFSKRTAKLALLLLSVSGSLWAEENASPGPLTLHDLVQEALAQNPEVQMAGSQVEAKQARVPQAGALPDPMLMSGVMNEGRPVPGETLGTAGFSEVYMGISQNLPYPGKRGLREKVAREEVTASEWAYEAVRRKVAAEVGETYYDLYAVHAALDILGRNLDLLEQFTKIARARFTVGQGSQQDVLDAEVELSRLEERRSLLEQRRATLEAALTRLLNRTSPAPLAPPVPIAETPLADPLERLLQKAEGESPVLKEKEGLLARGERSVDLARRERLPDLGVNFTYHNRGQLDPYYAFGGTLTLPIHAGRKQKKAIEEATADLGAARSAVDAARAEVRYSVTEAYLMASTADHLLRLYDEGILKQARLSLDSATAQYQVGKVDFLTLITSWRRLLDYDLTYHEQLAEHEKALVRLAVHVTGLAKEVF